jgi:hypothetical protein
MIALLFLTVLSAHLFEAWYDANFGDRHIIPVSFFQFCFSVLLAVILPSVIWWQGIAVFIAVRIWFDYMYNHFAGVWWGYMGKTALTDKILRDTDAYLLLFLRCCIFVLTINFLI